MAERTNKVLKSVATFEATLSYVLLVLLTILLLIQIINRYVFQTSFVWIEEISRISFVWLVYFSAVNAAREDQHVRVCIVDLFVSARTLKVVNLVADVLVVGFDLVVVWLGVLLIKSTIEFGDVSPVTDIPMGLIYAVIPICYGLMALRVIQAKHREFGTGVLE
jgi:C4-dicarboxylate transporter, DctQ subunit